MTDEVVERQQRRELRGGILRTLAEVYGHTPDTVSLRTICHVVQARSTRDIETELQYLLDLNYVIRIQDARDALDKTPPAYYRLSANGMRVVNGDVADASIEL